MANMNVSGLPLQDFLTQVNQNVTQALQNAQLEGKLLYSKPNASGIIDLNIVVKGSQAECLAGKLSQSKIDRIRAIRSQLHSLYYQRHSHNTAYYSKIPLTKLQQGVLTAFSNDTIRVECPRGMGTLKMSVG